MSESKAQGSATVRITSSLNQKEQEFVARRRDAVLQSLQKLQIHCNQEDVPNIALLGSGGGQRAMVGLLGSLVQLDKSGLLDCVLYLCGVSGSTWCMASLYQEPDWSTKLEMVKDKIIQRLSGPDISLKDAFAKLKKYYYGKNHFSLTDVWAVMFITGFVKEINEQTLTDQWKELSKDPFPIYTVIDKRCKQEEDGDPCVEITPHEAGYSLIKAFVDTCDFGSQFQQGSRKNPQKEFDMLYLQALCGSALGDEVEIKKAIWQKIKDFFQKTETLFEYWTGVEHEEQETETPHASSVEDCYKEHIDHVEMNIAMLNRTSPDTDVTLKENLPAHINVWPFDVWRSIHEHLKHWIWGTNYNFLHNMKEEAVPSTLIETETRDFIDAGLLNNSPYFPVLRKERNIDLIISLDFSQGDPFMTVIETAKACKRLNIPFPEVHISDEDMNKPKDFYVFKSQNAPTVIHMPLFNLLNCGDKLEDMRKRYATFHFPYSTELITDLVEIAGKNISNNIERLREEISAVIGLKDSIPNSKKVKLNIV